MEQRGFTLFTALVAFILIVLSLLLVQSMISTERSVSDIISDISEQDEMQAMADLARADALQVFNYGIRYSVEELSTRGTGGDSDAAISYTIFPDTIQSWGKLQKEFVKSRFGIGNDGKNQFALRTARHLISLLEKTPNTREFSFYLEGALQSEMEEILEKTFNAQAGENLQTLENFFEVINCPGGDYDTCTGTFYITIDLSAESMSAQDYEKFPLVRVKNEQTGRTLKEPILPRGKFRIYVPIRLFKALAASKEIGDKVFESPVLLGGSKNAIKADLQNKVANIINAGGYMNESDGFYLERWEVFVSTSNQEAGILGGTEKLEQYWVDLYFKDENEKYQVSTLNGDNVYGVSLRKYTG